MGIVHYIKKKLLDSVGIEEEKRFNIKTRIVATYQDTGEEVFTTSNKIILPGAEFLARAMFDLPGNEMTPTYNTRLGLDNSVISAPLNTYKTYLFCVGTDGCGRENSQVHNEDYRLWIPPESLAPFQYRPLAKDVTETARHNVYFGRKTLSAYYAYYFKRFDSDPVLTMQFTDGTPVDSSIYSTKSPLAAQTIVNMKMSITPDECRDYFIYTTGINDARINSISLCTAWCKDVNGYKVYQDIRPRTKLNFPNECLIDLNKGIDISYSMFF